MRSVATAARYGFALGAALLAACASAPPASSAPAPAPAAALSSPARTPPNDPPTRVAASTPPVVAAPTPAKAAAELPLGGRTIFPTYRLVGFCGTPGAPALGRLMGDLPARAKEMATYASKYEKKRKVQPVFELIATVVQGVPGPDQKYRRRVDDGVVTKYLEAARAAKALLLINVQPGHSDFMTEVKSYERFLREPDVGVALDPEWSMKPKQKPGVYYGQSTGTVVNEVAEYLSGIVKDNDLPEKALVVHQMNSYVFKEEEVLKPFPGIALIKSVDGLGPKAAKINTYNYLMKTTPKAMHAGFKLFFDEDTQHGWRLMSPDEVLALRPQPEYVMYE